MALVAGGMVLGAANPPEGESLFKPFSVGIQGGMMYSVSENTFVYGEQGRGGELFTPSFGLNFGYDFSRQIGIRLAFAYGKNPGACNTYQTSARGFYPFQYQSVSCFVDGMLSLVGAGEEGFNTRLYGGIGVGYSFGFTDSGHPWQKVSPQNLAPGFRLGVIAEYVFSFGLGFFADLCGEAFADNFSGLKPTEEDFKNIKGYPGFPLDLRAPLSLGVMYRF